MSATGVRVCVCACVCVCVCVCVNKIFLICDFMSIMSAHSDFKPSHVCLIHSEVQEVAGAEAPDAAEPSTCSSVPEAAPSSAPAAPSSPGAAEEAASSPKLVVVEADRASQVSSSCCTSQASVDDDDDVPITDIYFVSKAPSTNTDLCTQIDLLLHALRNCSRETRSFYLDIKSSQSQGQCVNGLCSRWTEPYDALLQRR